MILLGEELETLAFNEQAQEFIEGACRLHEGMDFDTLSGALRDMASEDGAGEAELLVGQMRELEECTIDYSRFDGKCWRMTVKPVADRNAGCRASLMITDISDIAEAERLMGKRSIELANEREELISRLKLVDAIVSEREAQRLRAEFFVRLTRLLDRFEDALDNRDYETLQAEIKRQREYIMPDHNERREKFAERLKKSVNPKGGKSMPRILFHHIARPKCIDLIENDIIEAARECVMLIAVCGIAHTVGISLRSFEDGAELNVRCDEPVVADFETAEPYLRLKKIAQKMHAELKADTSMGFDLSLRCVLPAREATVQRYKLTEVEQNIIAMIGQGMSSEKVASQLHYSQGSLRNMLSAIYEKLGISDKAQLTAFAILNGFSDVYNG